MPMEFSLLKYRNSVFIETGTYKGSGVRRALAAGFKKIYSVELKEEFYYECKRKFKKEIQEEKVELFLGESVVCLANILEKVDRQATFWLDAHYSSGDTAQGPIDVPLMEELELIGRHSIKNHTLLIDDVRLFNTKHSEDWSNIKLEKVIDKLKEINPNHKIFYESGFCKNDVLVAEVPSFSWLKMIGRIHEVLSCILVTCK